MYVSCCSKDYLLVYQFRISVGMYQWPSFKGMGAGLPYRAPAMALMVLN